jgi:hypothetical protein
VGLIRTYKGQGIQPAIYPELSKTDAKGFAPGFYPAGMVVAHQSLNLVAANDLQTITVAGTGGTFSLSFNGAVTAALPFNVTAAALQAALDGLSTIGPGNSLVGGGPGATAPLTVTFQGQSAGLPQPLIVFPVNAVTGGAGPSVVHTTVGRAAGGAWAAYLDTNTDGTTVAKGVMEYDTTVDNQGRHQVGGGEWGVNERTAPFFIAGYFRTADLIGLDAAGVADLGRIVEGDVTQLANVGTILKIN